MPGVHFTGTDERRDERQGSRCPVTRRSARSSKLLLAVPPGEKPRPAGERAALAASAIRDKWWRECPDGPTTRPSKRRPQKLRQCKVAQQDRLEWAARYGITGGVHQLVSAETQVEAPGAADAVVASHKFVRRFRSWFGAVERTANPEPPFERSPWPESYNGYAKRAQMAKAEGTIASAGPFIQDCRQRGAELQEWTSRGEQWVSKVPRLGSSAMAMRGESLSRPLVKPGLGIPRLHRRPYSSGGEQKVLIHSIRPDIAADMEATRQRWAEDAAHDALSEMQAPLSARITSAPSAPVRPRPQTSGFRATR
eukprot:Hpha_TRINITY_DN27905_c0_g1::TRINITY_DN27905_c0_g1_i1::g.45053::m.45053